MIVFELCCPDGHRFEGWFGSSDDFADQQARSLVQCPLCGSEEIAKAPMAPAVPAKGNSRSTPDSDEIAARDRADSQPHGLSAGDEPQHVSSQQMPAEVEQALASLAKAQAKALKHSTWVGERFAEESRAMHYGEARQKPIHGQATVDEARDLVDEGIGVAPLPFPVQPPDDLN